MPSGAMFLAMAAQEFTTLVKFTTAEYEAMAAAVRDGVAQQLVTIMNPAQARVLGRLVGTVLGSITAADVGSTVLYEGEPWIVAGTMQAGRAREIVVLDDPDGEAESIVLSGSEVEAITAVGGGDLLWLIETPDQVDDMLDIVDMAPDIEGPPRD